MRHLPGWVLALSLISSSALAHGDLHEQIRLVTEQLHKEPKNAALYHKRGEMHRAHAEYRAAFADYTRAEQLDPKLDVVLLSRGRAQLETHRCVDARKTLTRFLERQPGHAVALLMRARAAAELRKHPGFEQADADFRAAIAATAELTPDLFLERSENLHAASRAAEALDVLNEGLLKLPGVITLQLAALNLELRLQRFAAALTRIDDLIAEAPRKEALLARKAEILEQAGRTAEAQHTREQALQAIDALPASKRALGATHELAQALQQQLAAY
jgi:predicted Zn-dependent protease